MPDFMDLLANGIYSSMDRAIYAVQDFAARLNDGLTGSIGGMEGNFTSIWDKILDSTDGSVQKLGEELERVAELFDEMFEETGSRGFGGLAAKLSSGVSLPQMALAGRGTATTNNNNQKTTNLGGVSITVNGYNARNDDELARTIADKINGMMDEDESVYK